MDHVVFLLKISGLGSGGSWWRHELLLEWYESHWRVSKWQDLIHLDFLKGSLLLPYWGQTMNKVSKGKQPIKRPLHSGEDGGLAQQGRHKVGRSDQILTIFWKQSQVFPDRLGVGYEKKRSQGWIPDSGLSYWKDAIAETGKDEGEVDLGKKIRRLVLDQLSLWCPLVSKERCWEEVRWIWVWRSGESLSWRSGSGSYHHEDLI